MKMTFFPTIKTWSIGHTLKKAPACAPSTLAVQSENQYDQQFHGHVTILNPNSEWIWKSVGLFRLTFSPIKDY
jgi:hypothetical protein